jgi:hypothetical protein
MFVYIEYISRAPGVSLADFHEHTGGAQGSWESENSTDAMILNLARTWRVGPFPTYFCAWHTPGGGLARIDDWQRIFTADGARTPAEASAHRFDDTGSIDDAGCYEALLPPVRGKSAYYYGEFLDVAPGATHDDLRALFEKRQSRHEELVLNLLVDRIGGLGPDPRCLAFWSAPSFHALEAIARELDGVSTPVRLVQAGLYTDFAQEIL